MTATPDLSDIDAAAWALARERLAVIRPLAEAPERTRSQVAEAAARIDCGVAQTYELLTRYLADPRLTSLLPQRRGRKAGRSMLPPEVDAVIAQAIDDNYLTRQKPRVSDLATEVRRRCVLAGFKPPSRSAIERRLRARPAAEVLARRSGRKAARDRFAPATGSLEAPWPLSLIQIDHTLVDIIVVDSTTRAPIQRPWLTLAIDVHSRMVAGLHLSLEPPSATSVALCIAHAALGKESWLAERGIEGQWPVFGIPERLHLDNAKEFRSEALRRGCEQYGIAIDYRPVRTPHYGGHIERLIGTVMGQVHLLPGTTFSDVRQKGDLDPEKTAAMTLAEVERWLGHAVAGVYHQSLHRSLGISPLAAWRRGIEGDDERLGRGAPVAVVDPRRFLIDFLPIERRLVRREGVQLHGISYWSDVLSTWIGHPERLIVRYDPRDLSRIHLLGPDGTYYDLAYRDLQHPAISLWEHRLATKRLREAGQAIIDEAAIFRTVEAMRRIAEDAVRTSKMARRQQERRLRLVSSAPASAAPAVSEAMPPAPPADGLQPPERMFPVEEW